MKGFDSYMGKYLDKRMKLLIDEWDLATRKDLGDFPARLLSLEEETRMISSFEAGAVSKLAELEKRFQFVKEVKKR
jgi:hypothetical protein